MLRKGKVYAFSHKSLKCIRHAYKNKQINANEHLSIKANEWRIMQLETPKNLSTFSAQRPQISMKYNTKCFVARDRRAVGLQPQKAPTYRATTNVLRYIVR